MRTLVLVAGLCALAIAAPQHNVGGKEYLGKQKDVFRLFKYVNQPAYYKDFVEIANSFNFEQCFDLFTKPEYAKEFYYYYKHDILPRGEIFSVFNPDHRKQVVALFKTFYHAKDYETFYKTAVFARQNVNEGLYVYALSLAIVHGKFTKNIILPPIYEIYPQYFFNDEVIYKAQQYKQHYFNYEHEKEIKDASYVGYTIHANYSGNYLNLHPEQSMSYYTEDLGLNAYYFYYSIYFPSFLEEEYMSEYGKYRSEYFYHVHKRILTRYYLERLSNGFGEIPHFEYEYPIETGYYPSLTYMNGLHFPTRPNHANLYYHGVHGQQNYPVFGNYSNSYTYVKDYERRLRDALDLGYIYSPEGKIVYLYTKDGFKTLCNLVQSNADSTNSRYYGDLQMFASRLLGYSYYPLDENKLAPSALEHFETSFRDPMFYQMYKRILSFFFQYQKYMGPYEKEELLFDGVKVEDFQVDRLVTYFEYFYSDLSHAVYVDEKEFNDDSFQVRARQYRLNHKAFNYKIMVNSDRDTEAFVKVFIGPKYDEYGREIDMTENYMNFFEIDKFHYTLKSGKNVIERNSKESMIFSNDRTTYKQLYEQILSAYNSGETVTYTSPGKYYGIPQRLMLPKGEFAGKTYQIYVMVNQYHANAESTRNTVVDEKYTIEYPFDRPVECEDQFFVPNSFIKDVVIYHKGNAEDMNASQNEY